MPTLQRDKPVEPGFDFNTIDTTEPLRETPRKGRQPVLRFKPAQADTAHVDPFDRLSSAHTPHATPPVGLLRRIRNALLGKVAFHLAWMTLSPLVLHPAWAIDGATAVCAGIARLRGYKIDKAPDTDGGRAVTKAFGAAEGPKPGLVGRVLDPIRDTAAKPVAVVTAGAKKAVDKAGQKADEVKHTVVDEAHKLGETLQAAKAPPGPMPPATAPESPGILAQAQATAANAGHAVADKFRSLQPQPMTPEQVEQMRRAQAARNDQMRANSSMSAKRRNQIILNNMGYMLNAQASALADQSALQYQQQVAAGLGWQQQQANQVNESLRRRYNGGY